MVAFHKRWQPVTPGQGQEQGHSDPVLNRVTRCGFKESVLACREVQWMRVFMVSQGKARSQAP